MVSSRTLLIACGVGTLVLGACGSSSPSTKGGTSTTTKSGLGTTQSTTTFTTLAGSSATVSPVTSGTVNSSQTTLASGGATTIKPTTPTTATGGPTTTVKGRTVTSPSDNVKAGDKGDGVTKIQFALKAAGYKVTVDGTFGNQTDAAVRLFQKKVGLKVDGIVGKVTWAKLSAAPPGTATTVKPGTTATTVKGTTATTVKAGTTTTTGVK